MAVNDRSARAGAGSSSGASLGTGVEAGRIRVIDGFRALSITVVVLSHAVGTVGFPPALGRFLLPGPSGVGFFFVISGYLITALLLAEETATGRMSLRNFYVRRAFRILPALLCYIAVVALYDAHRGWQISRQGYLQALTFTTGVFPPTLDSRLLQHTWSLAIEEQFYLVWPTILVLSSTRRRFVVAAVIVLTSPIIHVLAYRHHSPGFAQAAPGWADMIMWGCTAAMLAHRFPVETRRALMIRPRLGRLLAFVLIVALAKLAGLGKLGFITVPFGGTLGGAALAYLILSYVYGPSDLAGRFLSSRLVVRLGVLSYSLYLWQQFFMVHELHLPYTAGLIWKRFPLNVGLSLLAASLSYRFVEAPLLRLRRRFLRPTAPIEHAGDQTIQATG